jgi:hypothetical protein
MAYVDPRESIVGGLLDKRGRVSIAEGVNGAILGKLESPGWLYGRSFTNTYRSQCL